MSKEHDERMSKIFAGTLPPQGTLAYKLIHEKIEKNQTPQSKKFAHKQLEIFLNSRTALSNNGVGYPIDTLLRYYVEEYNHRAAIAGLYSMPTSFNFMEAFMDYKKPLCIFLPKAEYNTLCSFTDFLDWATSQKREPNEQTLINSIESNRIHQFSSIDNPNSLKFRCANNIDVSILSAGIIRDRNEIVVLLQIIESESGKDFDPKSISSKNQLEKMYPFASAQKKGLEINNNYIHERVQLKGVLDGYESVAMMRFDIAKQAIIDRGIYQDWGDSYISIIDNIQAFGAKDFASATSEQQKYYKAGVEKCNGYQEVFELCRQFALLPLFESSYAAHTRIFEQPTGLKLASAGIKGKMWLNQAIDETKIFIRKVKKINAPRDEITGNLIVKVPSYTYEDSGYWKLLSPWEQGFDQNGSPEIGRTWIRQERPERASHSAHELLPSQYKQSPKADKTLSTFGYIYVMRSAQHEKDVFKIGLTTRDTLVRARELTSSTSSIDQFSVMEQWEVSDCYKAELEIHQQLISFRVNNKREFFKCNYRQIFSVIHTVIDSINNDSTH